MLLQKKTSSPSVASSEVKVVGSHEAQGTGAMVMLQGRSG